MKQYCTYNIRIVSSSSPHEVGHSITRESSKMIHIICYRSLAKRVGVGQQVSSSSSSSMESNRFGAPAALSRSLEAARPPEDCTGRQPESNHKIEGEEVTQNLLPWQCNPSTGSIYCKD